ncbi:hypothetical protein TNCV_2075971 [Trichonephila clavipes]|nr:hypothetical protein TNCV_2075971 [Trichonephila clavipes]
MARADCIGGPRIQHLRNEALAVQCTGNAYKRGATMKSNTTPDHDIGCRTIVAMHNATVKQPFISVSPNSNPTIVMLQAEAGFISRYDVVPFRCPCPPFIASLAVQTPCGHSTLL